VKIKKGERHYRDDIKLKLIGENIRKYRLAKGLTQNDLAFSCGDKDWSQISRMERGLVNFSISYLFLVADVLEIKPEDLFLSNNFNSK
jgi:transcriptional regulator with XRE-family HTH domain